MNMLKKGPEVKVPELKVPEPILNVFYDLRERHLLPLVAVLLVAIVAVPIALSQSSSGSGNAPSSAVAALGVANATTNRSTAVVVSKSAPGLHSYHQRLGYLKPINPFRRPFAHSESTSVTESSAGGTASTSSASGTPSETTSPGSTSSSPQTATTITHTLTWYSYAIDVRMVTGVTNHKKGSSNEARSSKGTPVTKSAPVVRRDLPGPHGVTQPQEFSGGIYGRLQGWRKGDTSNLTEHQGSPR